MPTKSKSRGNKRKSYAEDDEEEEWNEVRFYGKLHVFSRLKEKKHPNSVQFRGFKVLIIKLMNMLKLAKVKIFFSTPTAPFPYMSSSLRVFLEFLSTVDD